MLLRPGRVSLEEIASVGNGWEKIVLGKKTTGQYEKVLTRGMKYKHYSPTARVVLFEGYKNALEAISEYRKGHDVEGKKIAVLRSKYWSECGKDIQSNW